MTSRSFSPATPIASVATLIAVAGVVPGCGPSLRVHVPSDAPVGLPTIIGVPYTFDDDNAGAPQNLLARGPGGRAVPAQFVPDLDGNGAALRHGTVWLPLTISAQERGRTLSFALAPASSPLAVPVRLNVVPDQATQFVDGDRVILQYNHGPKDITGRDGPDAVTGYIHPILGVDGETLSQNEPADHLHHRGNFWAWPRLRIDGKPVAGDWWSRDGIRYRLQHVRRRAAGPVLATITSDGVWAPLDAGADAEPYVRECVTIRVFERTGDAHAYDVDIDLYAMRDKLEMAGRDTAHKGYGGFTFRVPRPANATITADGMWIPGDGNMYRTRWADYSGLFGGADAPPSGVAILTHPSHPGNPPGWCLRPYGILNPSYPGLDYVPLHRDMPLRLRYRVVLHRGTAKDARIADEYRLYAEDYSAE